MLRLLLSAVLSVLAATIVLQAQGPAGSGAGRGRGQSMQMPDGAGREIVQSVCIACHQLNMITGAAGYDKAGWRALITTMVALPQPQLDTVTTYLATNFAAKPGRAPKLISGPTKITFKEWMPPTLGQRPRDPLMTPDGTIWWAGMFASLIGRLNPATGDMKEYKLAPDARPHSILNDQAGNIWYTGNGNGTVGRLDPKTGAFKEWPSPSGETSSPYALVVVNDIVWYNESGMRPDAPVRFDPKTEKFQSWAIPGGGDIVRNMDVTRDGNPVLAGSLVNQVGVVTVRE
jgi:virginiamycin B lyase